MPTILPGPGAGARGASVRDAHLPVQVPGMAIAGPPRRRWRSVLDAGDLYSALAIFRQREIQNASVRG